MSLAGHVLFFLLISAVSAVAIAAIRLRDPRHILRESVHFLVAITLGVGLFCVLVYFLEWIFIRPLL